MFDLSYKYTAIYPQNGELLFLLIFTYDTI